MAEPGLWERRYRYLETQLEAVLRYTQRRMAQLEEESAMAASGAAEPHIRDLAAGDHVVFCTADGIDLEYRFFVTLGRQTLHDTGFTRLNSVGLKTPGALRVEVQVRSCGQDTPPVSKALELVR